MRSGGRRMGSRSAGLALIVLLVAGWAAAANAAPEPRAVDDAEENALSGVFEDCVMKFSFSCIQKKVLVFIERLGRRDMFGSLGGYLSVVRSAPADASAGEALTSEQALDASLPRSADARQEALESLMDDSVDRFFREHVLRVQLPTWLSATTAEGRSAATVIDVKLDDDSSVERSSTERILRRKKKKLLLGLLLLFKLKFTLMFFAALGLLGLKAIKALIIAKAAFALSAFLLFRKLMSLRGTAYHGHKEVSGGGYGGDSYSSIGDSGYGGGHAEHGWAARSQQEAADPHKLAYRAYAGNKLQ
ncbi:uncharacterized protein LOC124174159 [Ischnura elegans]|uniref:uncharacterized protein LOC124174159 n=1 Tax=Ischnura elegans TaxID=197161 RepID=UPI001ED892A6|nr:uncharacterized protein LOC124174159 [Ischnura elegans]